VDIYGDPLPAGAIARLGTLRLRHLVRDYSGAACVAFAPDGKTLVSGGDVGALVWDVATGKERGWFQSRSPATAAYFSIDGKVLLTADNNGSIRHWEVGTGKLLRQIERPRDFQLGGQESFFSPSGKIAGVMGNQGRVRIWDAESGKQLFEGGETGSSLFVSGAVSPDGKTLVISGNANRAHLIDIATGKELRQFEGPNPAPHLKPGFERMRTEAVYWFVFSPDGKLLAATGKDSVCAWDVQTGKLRYEIKGSRGHLAFSPDGHYLACGNEEAIQLFEAGSGEAVRQFERHAGSIRALAFSPDGRIVAGAEAYSISLWDVATGKHLHAFAGHEHPAVSLAFAPNGASLASGAGEDGAVLLWDLKTCKPRHALHGHYPSVLSIAYSPNGSTIATGDGCEYGGSGGLDAQIRLWNASDGRLLRQFPGHINSVQSLAFSPDGQTLASAGHDARVKVWDVATGKRQLQMRGADSQFRSVAYSSDGKTLLVAGTNSELYLCRSDSGKKVQDLGPTESRRRNILFASWLPDGRTVLTREQTQRLGPQNSEVSEVRLWEIESGRLLRFFPIRTALPFQDCYALSPDGRTLATAAEPWQSSTIQLWDTTRGIPLGLLKGHSGGLVTALAFSPDGKTLASSSRDTTILLWDVPRARLGYFWSLLSNGRDDVGRAIKKGDVTLAEAAPFFKQRLRRAAELEVEVNGLVANLDDDNFAVREQTSGKLADLGSEAAFALRLVLQRSPAVSVEARARVEKILERMKTAEGDLLGLDPRSIWLCLAVLEDLGTLQAQQALQELVKGSPKSTVVREARAAHERLIRRHKEP
jgi:WD40 repeat protein